MRHLAYALTQKVDGEPATSTLDVDLTAVTPDRGLTFRLVEGAAGSGAPTLDAHLARDGAVTFSGDAGFDDGEEVLLTLLSLSFDDMSGVEKGDKWTQVERTPDSTVTASYEVKSAAGSLVGLAINYAVAASYGWTATWQGKVTYDTAVSAPTLAELNGESPIRIKLAADSFASAQAPAKR